LAVIETVWLMSVSGWPPVTGLFDETRTAAPLLELTERAIESAVPVGVVTAPSVVEPFSVAAVAKTAPVPAVGRETWLVTVTLSVVCTPEAKSPVP
jgi:hypothetical protein